MPAPKFPTEKDLIPCSSSSSSKGNQRKYISLDGKWFYKQNFYYQGRYWRDDLVECIASKLASDGFKMPNCEVLTQYSSFRLGHYGTFSKNFLKPDEQFISFNRITAAKGIQVPYYQGLETLKYILDVYEKLFNIDALDFWLTQSLLDYLVGNEDRHINNFGAIKTATGFRLAPCFDFGLGMFEHDTLYEDFKFRDKLARMQFKPFDTNQERFVFMLLNTYPQMQSVLRHKVVQPSKFIFPSEAAETYLRYTCGRLGVKICND